MVAGKDAMKNGPAAFSMAASEAYKKMGDDEKKLLEDSIIGESEKTMTIKDIKREGSKLFRKIELQVCFKVLSMSIFVRSSIFKDFDNL